MYKHYDIDDKYISLHDCHATNVLYDWYAENSITNIGVEDTDNEYDDEMNYIGKGPAGHYELLQIAANVGMHLQKEGVIKKAWNILTQTASIA